MSPHGNYSIYMIDIFGSFTATFTAYLFGVLLVLIIGMQSGFIFNKMVSKIHLETKKNHVKETEENADEEAPAAAE